MNGKQSKRLRAAARANVTNENTNKTSKKKVVMRLHNGIMQHITVMRHTYSHPEGSFRSNLKEEKRRYYGKV